MRQADKECPLREENLFFCSPLTAKREQTILTPKYNLRKECTHASNYHKEYPTQALRRTENSRANAPRSLNSEIIACLEHAFLGRRIGPEERLTRARALRVPK